MRIFLIIALTLSLLTFGGFFYLSSLAKYSHGISTAEQRFEVRPGEDIFSLSARLKDAGIIASRYAFIWQLTREGKTHALVAGMYGFSGNLSIMDIALMVTEGKTLSRDIRVTFPEGWNIKKMAERLTANHLPGEAFRALTEQPTKALRQEFEFLSGVPATVSLEGFLFPDTYFFAPESSAEDMVRKMLANFDRRVDVDFRTVAKEQKRSLYDIVTLASIVENEVRSETDRKLVADIFLRRLATGQGLESCATLQYILGVDRKQYSYEETRTESPYNTYIHRGLPPGPIGNPGIMSLRATLFPQPNPYFYFLSDPKTGDTVFSTTYEEHLKNKNLYGL